MTICEKCGKPVRYIAAARSVSPDGIFMVDPAPVETISNEGRILTGFNVHVCERETVDNGQKNQGRANGQS
jgi:hypothetical protein